MSTNEQLPVNDGGNSTSEQIPHSGVHGFEAPVTEYGSTSLQDAHDQGLLEVPENPSFLTKEGKKRMSLKTKLGLALAGLGIAGTGGMVGKSMAGGETAPAPESNPAASATPTPGSSETSTPEESAAPEQETNVSEFEPTELSAEQYQDGDALIRALNDEFNKWVMSGVDLEDTVDWANPEDSIRGIAETYDQKYIDALFVSNWEDNPELGEMVATFTNQHSIVLNASIMTTDSTKPEDKEPYKQGDEVTMTEVIESTPGSMIVNYRHTMWSNADQNRGDMFIENVNGQEGGATVTFVDENGVWKISDIKHFAG